MAQFTFTLPDLGETPLVAQIAPDPSYKPGTDPVLSIRPAVGHRLPEKKLTSWGGSRLARHPEARNERALLKQKVVVVTQSQLKALEAGVLGVQAVSEKDRHKPVPLRSIKYDTLAIGPCPNPDEEYDDPRRNPNKEQTYTVLCRWTEDTPDRFPALEFFNRATSSVLLPVEQTDNFLISPRDPPTPPTPPISAGTVPALAPNDFKPVLPADDQHYQTPLLQDAPTVAVIDTGLKFNLKNLGGSAQANWVNDYHYRDADYAEKRFHLAYQASPSPECGELVSGNRFGCCTVTSYQEPSFIAAMNLRLGAFNPPYAGAGSYAGNDVRNSPYDDHAGRHGTVIAALIQQRANVAVLPVKSFDGDGFGCLYDVLNAFNYILRRHQRDRIQVVNASWITTLDSPLLRQKIGELKRAGIFLVAAAGNRNQTDDPNLSNRRLYPACYSRDFPNVITVTSVMDHYALQPKGGTSRPKPGVFAPRPNLKKALLSTLGIASTRQLRVDGLEPEANYSADFVNIGVAGLFGSMPSPFYNGGRIWGSSFAAPCVAAKVAEYLDQKAISLAGLSDNDFRAKRTEILDAIRSGTDGRLRTKNRVDKGRYLTA
mgnify:CR=1 FL=1